MDDSIDGGAEDMRRQTSTPLWSVRMEKRLGEGGERDDMDERGRWLEKMKDPRGDLCRRFSPR